MMLCYAPISTISILHHLVDDKAHFGKGSSFSMPFKTYLSASPTNTADRPTSMFKKYTCSPIKATSGDRTKW